MSLLAHHVHQRVLWGEVQRLTMRVIFIIIFRTPFSHSVYARIICIVTKQNLNTQGNMTWGLGAHDGGDKSKCTRAWMKTKQKSRDSIEFWFIIIIFAAAAASKVIIKYHHFCSSSIINHQKSSSLQQERHKLATKMWFSGFFGQSGVLQVEWSSCKAIASHVDATKVKFWKKSPKAMCRNIKHGIMIWLWCLVAHWYYSKKVKLWKIGPYHMLAFSGNPWGPCLGGAEIQCNELKW